MVVFKDVFILSRTFIENLPCIRHYAKQWLYVYNRTLNRLGIMGCKHKAILFYLPLSLKTLLSWEGFSSALRWFFLVIYVNRNFCSCSRLLNTVLVPKLEFLFTSTECLILSFKIFYWNIVALQCVRFCCTAKWISYAYTYTHSFFLERLFFHIGHSEYRVELPVLSLRRAWQLAVVFLPGKSCGQKSLVGYRP